MSLIKVLLTDAFTTTYKMLKASYTDYFVHFKLFFFNKVEKNYNVAVLWFLFSEIKKYRHKCF